MADRPQLNRKPGFTLIEVMAVCAVIALVLALLGPAIQESRAKARTVACRNNLKQMGLGLLNYHETYLSFPPAYVVGTKTSEVGSIDVDWNFGWGWQASILPFVDQAPLYNRLDYQLGLPTSVEKVATTKIAALRCGDDKGSALVSKVKVLGPLQGQRMTTVVENGFARSNYVGVAGWDNDWHLGVKAKDNPNGAEGPDAKNWSKQELGHDFRDGTIVYGALKLRDNKPLPNARDFHGIFGENSNRKLGHVTDGTANTIVVGERATPTKSDTENDVGNAIWAGVPDRSTRVGQSLSLGTVYWPINHKLDAATVPNTTGFNSRHGAGANFLLCDGSARTVSENIDLALLRRLGIIDDGSTGEIDIPTAK